MLVMMATYNGAAHVTEQVESILAQDGVDITLRICDDRSTDKTFDVCQRIAKQDARIRPTRNEANVGVGLNFMQMVYEADSDDYDYYAFSDQDDVWLSDKLIIAIDAIKQKECDPTSRRFEELGTPVLYCSDVQDVDSELKNPQREVRAIGPDLMRRGNPLVRNWFPGCTMVVNASLLRMLQQHPLDAYPRIHDAWVFMVAYYCGNVICDLDHARILRRITGHNVVGVTDGQTDFKVAATFAKEAVRQSRHSKERSAFAQRPLKERKVYCARELLKGYAPYLTADDAELVRRFAAYDRSIGSRLKAACDPNFTQPTVSAKLTQTAAFLLGRY